MGLFSFLQRLKGKKPVPETRKRAPLPQDPATVDALRTRARRRLIGAAVLVGAAVVGLPTLFDKPPRPAGQSFSVRMGSSPEGAAATPRPVAASGPASARPADPGSAFAASANGPVVAAAAVTAGAAATTLLPGTGRKPPADDTIITEPKSDPKAEAAARAARLVREQEQADKLRAEKTKADKLKADKVKLDKVREAEKAREAERAREEEKARLARARKAQEAQDAKEAADARREAARKVKEAKDAKDAKSARRDANGDKSRRYVIQAGSFAEASAARDLGRRIDKLGLDSHEQRVETASGQARTRVRLGPFSSKEDAQRAAARLKAAGLNAAVLPL